MKEYVLIHVRRKYFEYAPDERVLLIHKKRPLWMSGKLNLCGGKIELGETPIAAAYRELEEETGLKPKKGSELHCGVLRGNQSFIHCIRFDLMQLEDITADPVLSPRTEEDEPVEWFSFTEAFADKRLIPNLQLIISLMHAGVTGWEINDLTSSGVGMHEIQVLLPTKQPFANEK